MKIDKINLLPKNMRENFVLSIDEMLVVGFACSLFLMAVLSLAQMSTIKNQQKKMAVVGSAHKNLSDKIQELSREREKRKFIKMEEDAIRILFKNEIDWSSYFKEISLLIPKESWLTYFILQMERNSVDIEIRGKALEQKKIAHFFTSLGSSEYYKELALHYSNLEKIAGKEVYQFRFANKKSSVEFKGGVSGKIKASQVSNPLQEMMSVMENKTNEVNGKIINAKNNMKGRR